MTVDVAWGSARIFKATLGSAFGLADRHKTPIPEISLPYGLDHVSARACMLDLRQKGERWPTGF